MTTLRTENARLIKLLEAHGIDWRLPEPAQLSSTAAEPSSLSTTEKVALFRRLFRGRTDVYPIRWESKTPASPATSRPAPTNGGQASAKSRASSARTVAIGS